MEVVDANCNIRNMEEIKFDKGDFLQNKNPYEGESEYLIVDYDYLDGKFYGYKCATMKGKHCREHDFDNHCIIDKWQQDSYVKVG